MTMVASKARPNKKRIFLRVALLSWAVLVIALGTFIIVSIPYQRRVFVEQLESQGESLASSVSQVGYSSIAMSDYSEIVNHCLEVIEKNTSIRYIIVARKDGFALVHTHNGWRQEQLNGEVWLPQTANSITIPFYSSALANEEVFHYSHPLDYSGLTWGWIHIGLSLDKLKHDLRVLYGRTVGLSLVCAAVGFVLSFAFAKRMTQPIIALHNATIRVRNGDLTTRAEVKKTGDEIESLALSFNEMAETLQSSHRQLRATNEQLRTEVVERKQAEEDLRKTEEKYRMQFEGALDAIFVADAETGILLDCNPAGTRLVGRKKSELIGKHQRILHPPEENEGEFRKTFKQHLREKQSQTLETKVVTKTGEIKEVAIKSNLLEIRGKKIMQAIFQDITERKQAEEELKDSEEKFRVLFECAPDGYYLNDLKGNFIDGNRMAEQIIGFKKEELIKKNFLKLKLLPPGQIPKAAAGLAKNALGRAFGPTEYILNRKDGTQVWVEIRTYPVKLKGKTVVLGIARDITECKQAESELKAIQEKLIETAHRAGMAEVATDVLHNVGNVLNSVNVSTTVIREKITSSELANLEKVASIINEHTDDLGTFLTEDPQGKHIPVYLTEVSKCLTDEQTDIIDKL